ncbi:MAG: hypothetical protein ACKO7M_10845 [Acinetobacter junii]
MNLIADLADKYTFGEFRTTHEQNISDVTSPGAIPARFKEIVTIR